MTRFQVLYWQDVPSLVRVHGEAGEMTSHPLPDWFQQEMDRRAMAQDLIGSDAYLEQWRWSDVQERPQTADEVVAAIAAEFAA